MPIFKKTWSSLVEGDKGPSGKTKTKRQLMEDNEQIRFTIGQIRDLIFFY